MSKSPTSEEEFVNKTSLALCVFVPDKPESITDEQYQWFCDHADMRVRYLHANNANWKRELNRDGRSLCKTFISHWFEAFELNPERYMERNPNELMTPSV